MTVIWAHRGASQARPENTIAAFVEAKAQGADGVELDVRRSRDRALVIHHDAVLADGRAIEDLAVGDLPGEVPLLDAVLDVCADLVVNIEIKNVDVDADHDPDEYLAGAIVDLLAERGGRDRVLISSFSLTSIDRVRSLDGALATGYLASPRWEQANALDRAIAGGHSAFHPHHLVVNADLVRRAHDAGLSVHVWTVDEPDRMRWLVETGVDAIITNVPDLARQALR